MVSKLFIAIIVLALPFTASSELPPKTPEVPPQQKSDSPVEPQKQTTSEEQSPHQSVAPIPPPHSAIPSGESKNNGDKGGDEGSEFWPSFNRYRIKVTDSLLVIFTFLLFIATLLLWWSTKRLVKGADASSERQLRAYN